MKISRVEKAIGAVSPRWALRRYNNRMRLEVAERAYEAVELSRMRKQKEDGRSPDQIGALSIQRLRNQARYLDENHDIAKSVLNTQVSNVVGNGIMTIPQVRNMRGDLIEGVNDQIQILWADWVARPEVTWEHNWASVQELACRTWLRDGEVFSQMLMGKVPKLDHGSKVLFSLELLEPDFCPIALNDPDRKIKQGVQKNEWGRPAGFWFHKMYPTEGMGNILLAPSTMLAVTTDGLKRVNAFNIVHLKLAERIRQTRGVSIFASVFKRLDDLKDYEESERIAARIGAAFALAITKDIDAEGTLPSSVTEWREMDMAPGIVADNLAPGDKIESFKTERPDNKLADFRTSQLRAVAGGTKTGFSSISKQYEGSYSSQRQELMEQNQITLAVRGRFVDAFNDRIYKNFITVALTQGLISGVAEADPMTLLDAHHVGRGIPYVEPKREVEADIARIDAGITSRTQVILERGGDPSQVNAQLVRDKDWEDEHEISFGSNNSGAAVPDVGAVPDGDSTEAGNTDDVDNDSEAGERGLNGQEVLVRGERGRRGRRGERGESPEHEVDGSQIRWRMPDGTWGDWLDLSAIAPVRVVMNQTGEEDA